MSLYHIFYSPHICPRLHHHATSLHGCTRLHSGVEWLGVRGDVVEVGMGSMCGRRSGVD